MTAAGARLALDEVLTAAAPAGLVISAITARTQVRALRKFPSRDLVGVASATLAATAGMPDWAGSEGPTWFVTVAPGCIRVGSIDLGKGQRAANRAADDQVLTADLLASMADDEGNLPAAREGIKQRIEAWSAKSRANMTRRLSTLDYNELLAAGVPAFATLTYPGDWLTVAPNGKAVKRHLKSLRRRWDRRFGTGAVGVWKLEWQRRGAPHFHLLLARPLEIDRYDFRLWLAQVWAEIVGHPDPIQRAAHLAAGTRVDESEAEKMRDPRAVGVYFSKHGLFAAKDYQNQPPEEWAGGSIGRMWGYWGLEPAEVPAAVYPDQALDVSRTLRRLNRQHRYLRAKTVVRVEQSTGRVRYRTARRPVKRMPGSRGFVAVNDGPATAMLLDRVLTVGLGAAIPHPRDPAVRLSRVLAQREQRRSASTTIGRQPETIRGENSYGQQS